MTIKIRGLRWWIISLLTLGTITNYLARSSLSVAAPTVMQHLNISTLQYGWITGAFLLMLAPPLRRCLRPYRRTVSSNVL
jgi:MFS transporter, ACS family, hexuronate transporter